MSRPEWCEPVAPFPMLISSKRNGAKNRPIAADSAGHFGGPDGPAVQLQSFPIQMTNQTHQTEIECERRATKMSWWNLIGPGILCVVMTPHAVLFKRFCSIPARSAFCPVRSHFYCRSAPFPCCFCRSRLRKQCADTHQHVFVETTKLRCQIDTIEHIRQTWYSKTQWHYHYQNSTYNYICMWCAQWLWPMHAVAYLHLMRQIYLTGGLLLLQLLLVDIAVVAVTPKTKRTNCWNRSITIDNDKYRILVNF